MFTELTNNEERGQVGIGTLIVFIALVLVAAIAAGVLINTAGFLQSQAEATGQESTEQVSNNIQVESVVGTLQESGTNEEEEVRDIEIVVSQAPGSDDINLEELALDYIDPSGSDTLVFSETGGDDVEDGNYNLNEVSDSDDDNVLSDNDQRYAIVLNLADSTDNSHDTFGDSLQEGQEASLIITTESGSQISVELTAPDTLTDAGTDVRL